MKNSQNSLSLSDFASDASSPTHLKVGIYGSAGTGKTRASYEIVSGFIKDKNLKKEVLFFDTEKGSDWVIPLFKREGITCHVKKSRSFVDLMKAVEIAEKNDICLIIDSISHVWRELCDSFLIKHNEERKKFLVNKYSEEWAEKNFKKSNAIEFQHWKVIKEQWGEFTLKYISAPIHIVVCGRAGSMYEYQENENGKKELIQSGTRMSTEKEMSYEPSLLIELIRKQVNGQDKLFAVIEKDRSDQINGKEFELLKYLDIKAHVDIISVGKQSSDIDFGKTTSKDIFTGNTLEPADEFAAERKKREILLEEIKGELETAYPGSTADAKQKKNELFKIVFETHSWTKAETMSSEKLKEGLDKIKKAINGYKNTPPV